MVLKLYGVSEFHCTKRVALILREMGVQYELHTVDISSKEHKSDKYLDTHPFGQTPYIDDDGFIVYESRAVCRYIALKHLSHGPQLIPPSSDLEALAQFEQAASVELSNFDAPASVLYNELLVKPFFGEEADKDVVEKALKLFEGKMEGYERILTQQKYLAGEDISLADLFHLPVAHALETRGGLKLFKGKPNAARWWNDLQARPAWQSVKDGA